MPGKVLLPYDGELAILDVLIGKLKQFSPAIPIVFATTVNPNDDRLEDFAKKNELQFFRGDENDVLKRFIDAAEIFDVQNIFRICSDNPFLDLKELHKLIDFIEAHPEFDYVSFEVNDSPSIKTHYGFWAEFTTLSALKKVKQLTDDHFFYEHVTNFIYGNRDQFKVHLIPYIETINPKIRMTVDTPNDFELSQAIFKDLKNKYGLSFGIKEITSYLNEKASLLDLMEKEIINNTK